MTETPTGRDRDDSGRPRNARPRDALGRPLPAGRAGVPRIPDDLTLPAAETLSYAQDLLDAGRAFHAHEVFEAAWKSGLESERLLWQSLAQLAVGITHIQRGNAAGAAALLRRADTGLTEVGRPVPHGIDADGLIACAAALITDLDDGAEIDPSRLQPRLTTS